MRDGVLENPASCGFNPRTLQCSAADAPDCLTPAQVGYITRTTPTGLAPRGSPPGLTWHHNPATGVMQLVDRLEHAIPHSGGFSIWGR